MLQQTQVKTMLRYWERWMRTLPDIEALAAASMPKLHKLWEGLGYYNRVRNMQKAARMIVDLHGGQFPRSDQELQDLPGIGRYTAGAIRSIAFDQPAAIVDGNVMRVLTRAWGIGGDPRAGKVNQRLWGIAEELVLEADVRRPDHRPAANKGNRAQPAHREKLRLRPCSALNQALMELGALVCTPKKPLCAICPISQRCVALREGRVDHLPELAPRSSPTHVRVHAFLAQQKGDFLVRQRPADGVNAHLWEFPNVEVGPQTEPLLTAHKVLGGRPRKVEHWLALKHSITRYRITLEVYRVSGFAGRTPQGTWLAKSELSKLALSSAHKKILMRLPQGK